MHEPEIEALAVAASEDLSLLSRYLFQQGVAHRIIEQAGEPGREQRVLVSNRHDAERAHALYIDIKNGKLRLQVPGETPGSSVDNMLGAIFDGPLGWFTTNFKRYRVVLIGVLLSVAGALLVAIDKNGGILHYLTFYDYRYAFGRLQFIPWAESIAAGQWWRIFTPVFLHFGLMHLAFNMLWFWELGRRVEVRMGSLFLLLLVVVLGIGSNAVQASISTASLFGGMSGVIYGLLGFCWVWDIVNPKNHFDLPPGIVGFMLVWLVLCFSGVVTAFGFGAIANAAHLSGLINGCLLGALSGWYFRGHQLPSDQSLVDKHD